MKNDFRNDGAANMGWLADGDVTARLDVQGFLKDQPETTQPQSEYERLRAAFYDHAKAGTQGVDSDVANALKAMGFDDLAHQVQEGMRDAQKERWATVDWGDADEQVFVAYESGTGFKKRLLGEWTSANYQPLMTATEARMRREEELARFRREEYFERMSRRRAFAPYEPMPESYCEQVELSDALREQIREIAGLNAISTLKVRTDGDTD